MTFIRFLVFVKRHKVTILPSHRYIGVFFTLFSWFCLALCTTFNQSLDKSSFSFTNLFFRFLFMFLCLLVFSLHKGLKFFKPIQRTLVFTRGFIAVLAYYAYLLATAYISSVDNSMLFSTDAVLIPLILLFFFNIRINILGWSGILIGFMGIAFVYSFDIKFSTPVALIGGCLGLFSGFARSIMVILSSYTVKHDPPLRIALYEALIGTILSGIIAIFNWHTPTTNDLLTLFYTGALFSVTVFLALDAFYYTESYLIGVLGYSLVLFLGIFNWIIYRHPVTTSTIVGSCLICLGGMLAIWGSYKNDRVTTQ